MYSFDYMTKTAPELAEKYNLGLDDFLHSLFLCATLLKKNWVPGETVGEILLAVALDLDDLGILQDPCVKAVVQSMDLATPKGAIAGADPPGGIF